MTDTAVEQSKSMEAREAAQEKPVWHSGRPKDGPMWSKDVTDIPPPARRLLENYSGIPSNEVVPHALELREKAWGIAPYGCVGLMGFTLPTIQDHPLYSTLLSRLKSAPSTSFLDLGCGFGQNIRQLVLDGAPPSSVTGADLSSGLVECGYDYFRDRDSLSCKFLVGDVLNPEDEFCKKAQGQFDVVWAAIFFHLWGWDKQLEASVTASKLLKPAPGSVLFGWQIGAKPAREFVREREGRKTVMYQHDEESLTRLWEEVGRRTGSKWRVEATNDRPKWLDMTPVFMSEGVGRITFTIERVE